MAMSVVYTTVNGQILHENRGGVVSHFVSDPLGSVVMVRDNAGNTVYEAEYDPYGNVQSETGTNPSEFGYVGTLGYVKDSAFSLYVRARYLLTNLGRWLTKDPLWPSEPGFVYAGAAPNMRVDPSGLLGAVIIIGGAALTVGQWIVIGGLLILITVALFQAILEICTRHPSLCSIPWPRWNPKPSPPGSGGGTGVKSGPKPSARPIPYDRPFPPREISDCIPLERRFDGNWRGNCRDQHQHCIDNISTHWRYQNTCRNCLARCRSRGMEAWLDPECQYWTFS